ncbi:MAG: tetratricopeptide repeat protein [Planctomycetes bacterium]|nr:tetratricopeptide repeat protein [Planctomycetota bacterium]
MKRNKLPLTTSRRRRRLVLGAAAVVLGLGCLVLGRWPAWESQRAEREFGSAEAAIARGDLKQALRIVEDLASYHDFAPHRHYLRGLCYLREQRLSDALDELQYSRFHPQLEAKSFVASGHALYEMGKADQAVQMWTKTLAIDPDVIDAHRWLAVYYYDVGATADARQYLRRVAELDPADGRPDRLMGLMSFDAQNFDEAIEYYRESLRRDPQPSDRESVLAELAESETKLHHYDEALEVLKQCQPSVIQKVLTAECYFNQGDVQLAIRFVDEALRDAPNDIDVLELKGRCLLHEGQVETATKVFEKAVGVKPKDYIVRLQLAQTYHRLGRTEEAKQHSEIGRGFREMWNRFADLHEQAVRKPSDAAIRFEMGKLAMELDRPDLAKEWFRATMYLDSGHAQAAALFNQLSSRGAASPAN